MAPRPVLRLVFLVELARIELATPWLQTRCSPTELRARSGSWRLDGSSLQSRLHNLLQARPQWLKPWFFWAFNVRAEALTRLDEVMQPLLVSSFKAGGRRWIRTTDLTLIRGAL